MPTYGWVLVGLLVLALVVWSVSDSYRKGRDAPPPPRSRGLPALPGGARAAGRDRHADREQQGLSLRGEGAAPAPRRARHLLLRQDPSSRRRGRPSDGRRGASLPPEAVFGGGPRARGQALVHSRRPGQPHHGLRRHRAVGCPARRSRAPRAAPRPPGHEPVGRARRAGRAALRPRGRGHAQRRPGPGRCGWNVRALS